MVYNLYCYCFFYIICIISQGVNCAEDREVSTCVNVDQIPFVMRAIGYYPSEQEVCFPLSLSLSFIYYFS